MPITIKITVVGGERNGSEMSFSCVGSVLVGRSRSAVLHLPEPDVSGRHFEFVAGDSGCEVKVLSSHGLVVDGRTLGSGDVAPVKTGSSIEVGSKAKIRVDAIYVQQQPSVGNLGATADADIMECAPSIDMSGFTFGKSSAAAPSGDAAGSDSPASCDLDADTATDDGLNSRPPKPNGDERRVSASVETPVDGQQSISSADFVGEEAYDGNDTLTVADGDGETQEMKTRIGSMEEILERKRQLNRAQTGKRVRFAVMIALLAASLVGVWLFMGWSGHSIDVDGPYLENGEFDESEISIQNAEGENEFVFLYPRNDAMSVSVSPDSNKVEIASWFGTRSDVPFHLEFTRWTDRTDLQNSLEESFEKWMTAEVPNGTSFATDGGRPPEGEFFENVCPGMLELKTLYGVRFVRAEYTRSRGGELWRGNCVYFRNGDMLHLLRLEIPDMFWKIAGRRVTKELHIGIYSSFSDSYWDSPGKAGLVDTDLTDDQLVMKIRHDMSGDCVSSWPTLSAYIDTLLVRSWGDKETIQKEGMSLRQNLLDQMSTFYREREFAFSTAVADGNEKRMKSILKDCKSAFGALKRDRRSTLVNNPEVWSCRPRR